MNEPQPLTAAGLPTPPPNIAQTELYADLRAEVAKLDASHADVDWRVVESLSQRVLQTLGQDLLAAAYWAHARHVSGGPAGLCDGLALMSDLLTQAWEQLAPPVTRIKARAGALQWLVQRTEIALAASTTAPHADEAARMDAALTRFEAAAQQRFEARAPTVGRARQSIAVRRTQPKQPTPLPSPPNPAPPVASPPAAEVRPTVPTSSAPPQALMALGRDLCALAHARRAANAADASAYRLLREGLYLHLEHAPPLEGGRTLIAPLPAPLRERLVSLGEQKHWLALIEQSEQLLREHRLCFDLHRLTAQALWALGETHQAAHESVRLAVRALITRLPEVTRLLAVDGSPLSDAATHQWLKGLLHPSIKAAPRTTAIQTSPSPKAAAVGAEHVFRTRLDRAEAAQSAGHVQVALALYCALEREARRRGLMGWDPALGCRLLRGYYACMMATAAPAAQTARVFAQLAVLDADAAIALQQGDPLAP